MAEAIDMTRGSFRLIYANYIYGKRINQVSLGAEAFFWRIHTIADDFGNLPADTFILERQLAGRRKMTEDDIQGWLNEMAEVGLIEFYTGNDGEPYAHINDFEDRQPKGFDGKRNRKRRVQRFPLRPSTDETPPVNEDDPQDTNDNADYEDCLKNEEGHAERSDPPNTKTVSSTTRDHNDNDNDNDNDNNNGAHERTTEEFKDVDRLYDEIKAAYPKQAKMRGARTDSAIHDAACTIQADPDLPDGLGAYAHLLDRVTAYARAVASWPPGDSQFVPDFHRWLAEGQYYDDPATWHRGEPPPGNPKELVDAWKAGKVREYNGVTLPDPKENPLAIKYDLSGGTITVEGQKIKVGGAI